MQGLAVRPDGDGTVVTVTEVTVFSGGGTGLSEYFQIVSNNNR